MADLCFVVALAASLLPRSSAAPAVERVECRTDYGTIDGACRRGTASGAPPRVNASRLWASVEAMAAVGAFLTPGGALGVRREALTAADNGARRLLDSWAAELGLKREVDAIGNTYYRQPGRRPQAGALAFGSHLDTQPSGGRFTGSYGVLAGLELLRTLKDLRITTDLHLELVNWSNEEGSRFQPAMMGSGVATGEIAAKAALDAHARDKPALTVLKELQHHGLAGKSPGGPLARNWIAYFEPHIEQGKFLHHFKAPAGVVIGGYGQRTFSVEVDGVSGHSGTVPMAQRKDALVCASAMVLRARKLGIERGVLMTVGTLAVQPGNFFTIPSRVSFSVDVRSPKPLDAAEEALRRALTEVAVREGCGLPRMQRVRAYPTVLFDQWLRSKLNASARALGFAAPELWSGSRHGACYVANRVPAAMLFVPSEQGPVESAAPADLATGADVLLGAVLRAEAELPWRHPFLQEFHGQCTQKRLGLLRRICGDGCDVIFLGDSIMERMAGVRDMCRPLDLRGRMADHQVYQATFARHGRSVILAGKSDETNHTLFLLDKLLPRLSKAPKAPKLYSLLIGTNNIGNGGSVSGTVADIKTIIQRLHQVHPSTTVLLHAILPRTDGRRLNLLNQEVNKGLRAYVDEYPGKLEFLDCAHVFPDHRMKQLTDDGLHPNVEGYTQWYLDCMRPALERLVGPSAATKSG